MRKEVPAKLADSLEHISHALRTFKLRDSDTRAPNGWIAHGRGAETSSGRSAIFLEEPAPSGDRAGRFGGRAGPGRGRSPLLVRL